jgi:hypothetical protein
MSLDHLLESSTYFTSQALRSVDWSSLIYQFASVPFDMEIQTQTNWCWAATSTSVSHFYSPLSTWTQCRVAGAELNRTDCCNSTVPSACNVPWYLDRALTRTSNFDRMQSGTISYNEILTEIRAGRVVGARQGWSGGGGHFMVIYGASRIGNSTYLDIDDPIWGKSTLSYDTFATNYQGSGSWTHTYFTKRRRFLVLDFMIIPEYVVKWVDEQARLKHLRQGLPTSEFKSDFALAVPHPVFSIGLDSAAKGKFDGHESGLRVLQMRGGQIEATLDFDPEHAEAPKLQSTNSDAGFNASLARAFDLIAALPDESGKPQKGKGMELRSLKLPALYVEALWLHASDGKSDTVIVTRGGMILPENRLMPLGEFTKAVQAAAKERLESGRDDQIAP